ncbi:MAG: TetR/AcrR family transcriptional regulator [Armatimonadetes bacterium]|nr:TetR/AcrR family transcriptional regulator [Armatimonadota bacterium]
MDQRERILEAASVVIGDKGFHAASMRDLAEAAGVALGTLYLYFDSKQALLTALVEDLAQKVAEQLREAASGRSAVEALGQFIARWLKFFRSQRPQVRAVLAEALFDEELARSVRRAIMQPGRRVLAQLLKACGSGDSAGAAALAWELIVFEGVMTPELSQRRSAADLTRAVLALAGCRNRRGGRRRQ